MHIDSNMSANEKRRIRRRKRRKEARNAELPEKLDVFVPESKLYTQLIRFEQRIDASITRAKLDIQEAIRSPRKIYKILRLHLSHTVNEDAPGFKFRIQGILLDPQTSNPTKDTYAAPFSKFFQKVVVHLDPKLFPAHDASVEWSRLSESDEVDGFEVCRSCPSAEDTQCRVVLYLDDYPRRYKLPPQLAQVLGVSVDTRARIMQALWMYIKRRQLQDSKQPTHVICDEVLSSVFETSRLALSDISAKLMASLLPPDPIVFLYRITMSGDTSESRQVFDVSVQIPEIVDQSLGGLLKTSDAHKTSMQALDDSIHDLVEQINEKKYRLDLLNAFAESPIDVIRIQLAHQSRDLQMLREEEQLKELQRHSAFFNEEWISDAVDQYVEKTRK